MKVLYTDSDPKGQINFVRLKSKFPDWKCSLAMDLRMSCNNLDKNEFDIVFTDTVDQAELTQLISKSKDAYIVLVGELEEGVAIESLKALGVNVYCPRPLTIESLKQIGNTVLSSKTVQTDEAAMPDFGYLDRLTKGRVGLKIDLLKIFIDVVGEERKNATEAMEKEDWATVSASFHRMKSNTRMLGLHKLLGRMDQIEDNAKQRNNLEELFIIIPETVGLLERASGYVEEHMIETEAANV